MLGFHEYKNYRTLLNMHSFLDDLIQIHGFESHPYAYDPKIYNSRLAFSLEFYTCVYICLNGVST